MTHDFDWSEFVNKEVAPKDLEAAVAEWEPILDAAGTELVKLPQWVLYSYLAGLNLGCASLLQEGGRPDLAAPLKLASDILYAVGAHYQRKGI